jgi:alkyldihydroxyacetonephosphate synthase
MRRWNGWGDNAVDYPLPEAAQSFIEAKLGPLTASPDVTLNQVLPTIPPSRLPPHNLIHENAETRLAHARGQSLPDWIAMRYGRIQVFPDGVTTPGSEEEVQDLLTFASREKIQLIPYGGGTSVVGHINSLPSVSPNLVVDLRGLNQLLAIDPQSRLASFQAGVRGPEIEASLKPHGFTLGHFPQSFEYSTLGGWIATRSSGQQSYYYGRIEDLFVGGQLISPQGTLHFTPFPASAAGPDLRQIVLGSEGRLGILAQATVRIQPLPEFEAFYGAFFRTWEAGVSAVQTAVQQGLRVSMVRFSDPVETETSLILSGQTRLVANAKRALSLLGYGTDRGLLIYGLTGTYASVRRTRRRVAALWRSLGGLPVGKFIGETWRKSRFRTPYLRNTLWEAGVALDTLETALTWKNVLPAAEAIKSAIQHASEKFEEQVLVFAHLSHVYPDGASIYVTFLFRRTRDPDELLARWKKMKSAASKVILTHGGTISHQHGVGLDHAPYLIEEKGSTGMDIIQAACRALDPQGLMNPGKLFINMT